MAGKKNEKSLKNLKPFKPGESGNPAGSPKGKRFKTVIRELLEQEALIAEEDLDRLLIDVIADRMGRRLSNRELIVFKQLMAAAKGDTSAFNALADREEGRPIQTNKNENVGITYLEYLDNLKKGEE